MQEKIFIKQKDKKKELYSFQIKLICAWLNESKRETKSENVSCIPVSCHVRKTYVSWFHWFYFPMYDRTTEKNHLFRSWRQWNLTVLVVVAVIINRTGICVEQYSLLAYRDGQHSGIWIKFMLLCGCTDTFSTVEVSLHAGHLPSITDSTFSNFAGIRARICVASSSPQVQNVTGDSLWNRWPDVSSFMWTCVYLKKKTIVTKLE